MIASKTEILLNQAKYSLAYDMIKESLQNDPDNTELLYQLSICCIELKKEEEAEEILDQLLHLNPKDPYVFFVKAALHREREEYREAFQCINDAIQLNPFQSIAYYERAIIQAKVGNLERAIEDVEKALQFDAEDADYMNLLSILKKKKGDIDGSNELLERALSIDPNNTYLMTRRAYALFDEGKREEAEELFQNSLRIAPDNVAAQQGYRQSIKAKYQWYYGFKKKFRKYQSKVNGNQLILIGMTLIFVMMGFMQIFEQFPSLRWFFSGIILIFSIIAIGLLYLDPILNGLMLGDKKYAQTMTQTEKQYAQITMVLIVIGFISFALGMIQSNALMIVSGSILLLMPFFLKWLFVKLSGKYWNTFSAISFFILSYFSIHFALNLDIVFNDAFVWILLLTAVHLWVNHIYKL